MTHRHWIVFNALVIGGAAAYLSLFHPHPSSIIRSGQLAAWAAVLLFLVNLSLAVIFFVIKRSDRKSVKTAFVKLARKLMKSHIYIGVAGTALIVIHAGIMLVRLGRYIGYLHPKMFTGYAALLLLGVTVTAGYLRSRRASGFRRKFHLAAALVFAVLALIHILAR